MYQKKKKIQRQNLLTDMSGFEDYIPTKKKKKHMFFQWNLMVHFKETAGLDAQRYN